MMTGLRLAVLLVASWTVGCGEEVDPTGGNRSTSKESPAVGYEVPQGDDPGESLQPDIKTKTKAAPVGRVYTLADERTSDEELIKIAADGEFPEQRLRAVGLLRAKGDSKYVPPLLRATRDEDEVIAITALQGLADLLPETVVALDFVTRDPRERIALAALKHVQEVGFERAPISGIVELVNSDLVPEKIRAAAAQAAGELLVWSAMDGLLTALTDESVAVRLRSYRALTAIARVTPTGWQPKRVKAAQIAQFRQNFHKVYPRYLGWVSRVYADRLVGKKALGRPGTFPRDVDLENGLIARLNGKSSAGVVNTIKVLGTKDSPAVVIALRRMTGNADAKISKAAAAALFRRNNDKKFNFKPMPDSWLENENLSHLSTGVYGLAVVDRAEVPVSKLQELLTGHESPQIRAGAAYIAGRQLLWSMMPDLVERGLRDKDVRVRIASYHAIVALTGQSYIYWLGENKEQQDFQVEAISKSWKQYKGFHDVALQRLRTTAP
jgi:HEAT repeat protein